MSASNVFDTPTALAAEALTHMEANLVLANMCARDVTSEFTSRANGWKVGESVPFRTHGEYTANEFATTQGTTVVAQGIANSKRTLMIEKHLDVSVEITAREQKMSLSDFSAEVIAPAAYALAEKVDKYVGSKLLQAAGMYASTDLFGTAADVALARKAANLQRLGPNRICLLNPTKEAELLGEDWFNQVQTRGMAGGMSLATGQMGYLMGMNLFSSVNFPEVAGLFADNTTTAPLSWTCGTAYGMLTNNGSASTTTPNGKDYNYIGATTLYIDSEDGTTGTFVAGDRLQIAGVNRPLIVKTNTSAVAGAAGIPLVDPITEIIPDDAAVSIIGKDGDGDALLQTVKGVIMDSKTLGLTMPMLDLPQDRVAGAASNNGVNLRMVAGYDVSKKLTVMSLDCLVGAFMLDPRKATLLVTRAA